MYARAFATVIHFLPSLIFAGKSWSLPLGEDLYDTQAGLKLDAWNSLAIGDDVATFGHCEAG
jgi:hypothetical protein